MTAEAEPSEDTILVSPAGTGGSAKTVGSAPGSLTSSEASGVAGALSEDRGRSSRGGKGSEEMDVSEDGDPVSCGRGGVMGFGSSSSRMNLRDADLWSDISANVWGNN